MLVQIAFASHVLFDTNVQGWSLGLTADTTRRLVDEVVRRHPRTGEMLIFPRFPFSDWNPFELKSREFRDEFKGLCQSKERFRGFPKGCSGEEDSVRGRIWVAARESFRKMLEIEGTHGLFDVEAGRSVLKEREITGLLVLSKLNETAGPHPRFYDIGFVFCGHWHMAIRRNTTFNVKNLVPSDPTSRVGTGQSSCAVPPNLHADFMYMENVLPTYVGLKLCTFYRVRHKTYMQFYRERIEEEGLEQPPPIPNVDEGGPLVCYAAASNQKSESKKRKQAKQREEEEEEVGGADHLLRRRNPQASVDDGLFQGE